MSSRAEDDGRHQRWDAAIAVAAAMVAVAAPLCIGGVHPTTQLILSSAVLALSVAYAITRLSSGIRILPFVGLFGAFVAVDLVQLLPLPAGVVRLLSPAGWELRSAIEARGWMPLTVDVPATALAAVRGFACLGLLATIAGVSRTRGAARRVMIVLAVFGGLEALIALIQRAVGAKAILGLYVPRSTSGMGVFGTLVNSNHTASVLTIGALAATALALDVHDIRRRVLFGASACVAAAVVIATGSRGGALGLAVGGFLLLAVQLVRTKGVAQGLVAAVAMLAVFAAVALWSGDQIRHRLTASPHQLIDNQKTRGWADGLRMAADYRWTGVGRGAFEAPLRAYRSEDEEVRLVYPENFVVQAAAEWGIVATLALFFAAGFAAWRIARDRQVFELPPLGALAAVVAVTAHELMDFGTEFPGVAFPATACLGVVVGVAMRRHEGAMRLRPVVWSPIVATWVAVLLLGGWASSRTLDADDLRSHDAAVARRVSASELATAIARHPADDYLELLAAEDALLHHDPAAMRHVNRALLLHPASWRAHEIAARLLIAAGKRPQAAIEFGLAARYGLVLDDRELLRLLGSDIVDTVPQQSAPLMAMAERMIAIGRTHEAEIAWNRALELSDAREATLRGRANAALNSRDASVISRAASALLAEATAPASFVVAADAFAAANDPTKASMAIDRGLRARPGDPTLVLAGARLKLAAGDVGGANRLLTTADVRNFTLEQRRDAQLMLVTLAVRAGDAEGAAIAHARAQLLERQIREITSATRQGSP